MGERTMQQNKHKVEMDVPESNKTNATVCVSFKRVNFYTIFKREKNRDQLGEWIPIHLSV